MSDVEEVETTEAEEVVGSVETNVEAEAQEVEDFKAKWEGQRKVNRDLEKKLDALREELADRDRSPEEAALEQVRREARDEAQAAFNSRLVQAEVKAALVGKVTNPALALKVLDFSAVEVGGEGEVDARSVMDAINTVLESYPELAPSTRQFAGTADQGAKRGVDRPSQLSKSDLSKMTPEQIVAAYEAGQLSDLTKGS